MAKTTKQSAFDELHKLLDEMRRDGRVLNPTEIAERFAEAGLSVSVADLPEFVSVLVKGFGRGAGVCYVPGVLLQVLGMLLERRSCRTICDPWSGLGVTLAKVQETTKPDKAIAITTNEGEAALGRVLLPVAEWRVGDPCQLVNELNSDLDVLASVLPFGACRANPTEVIGVDGSAHSLRDDLGHLILAVASLRLSKEGTGLFVVPESFFSRTSVIREFDKLGLGIKAALALPAGAFEPYVRIATYLVRLFNFY